MRVVVIEAPAPVVAWKDADAHLKLSGDEDQKAEVEAMIAASFGQIDGPMGWLGRALGLQTLEARFDGWECREELILPCPPILDIVSIVYRDADGNDVTVDPAAYELIERTVAPTGSSVPWAAVPWRRREGLRVRFRAGYVADPDAETIVSTLPASIRSAILLMLGDLYAHRETAVVGLSAAAVPMSTTVTNLLAPFRIFA